MSYDVIVVGAGSAGLSAALVLGRARRRVLVLDGGPPRNAPADAAHGFLTRDGTPPTELLRLARDQLRPYGAEVRRIEATSARPEDLGFKVMLSDGEEVSARRLLLTTGVLDLLPEVPGMREVWGRGVYHCPYCHGWEVRDRPAAVYGSGEDGYHMALMLRHWTPDLVLCTGDPAGLSEAQQGQLRALGIPVVETPVVSLEGRPGRLERLVFADGSALEREAVFMRPRQQQRSSLPEGLGCALSEDGVYVQVNAQGETSVPGVYAAGDMTGRMQAVVLAAASGAWAAMMLNSTLVFADAEHRTSQRA